MKYNKGIDSLRFVAILLVLLEHFATIIGGKIHAGYLGVDLFFVLSGFLITGILLNLENNNFTKNYITFVGRRSLRIFPIYYLLISLMYVFQNEDITRYILYCITYTYNYAWISLRIPLNSITHFWSLCVEEQFYLFWPVFILLTFKIPRIQISLIVAIIVISYLQLYFSVIKDLEPYNSVAIFPKASSLAIGALGAFLVKNKNHFLIFTNYYFEIFLLGFIFYLLADNNRYLNIFFPLISLIFIMKIYKNQIQISFINKFLNNSRFVYLGSISYGIYLYHMPISYFFTKYIFDPIWFAIDWSEFGILSKMQWHSWVFKFPIYSFVSFIVAGLSYKYLEKPLLNYKDKWFPYYK